MPAVAAGPRIFLGDSDASVFKRTSRLALHTAVEDVDVVPVPGCRTPGDCKPGLNTKACVGLRRDDPEHLHIERVLFTKALASRSIRCLPARMAAVPTGRGHGGHGEAKPRS